MFSFFKSIKEKKELKLRTYQESLKRDFINYINAYENQNSTMETMYLLIHGLELDIKLLIEKYNLIVDFDFSDEDDYYEVQIYSSNDNKDIFFVAVTTQEGINTILLQDGSELEADQFTTNEIMNKIIEEIETYHSK